jgi:hypothetical protein
MASFIIRARDGRLWQTSRGFITRDVAEATKYRDATEAQNAAAMCCPAKALPQVEEIKS